jgi:hypothetical protein
MKVAVDNMMTGGGYQCARKRALTLRCVYEYVAKRRSEF